MVKTPTVMEMPESFPKMISDMTHAMTTTFPEYEFMWSKWYLSQNIDTECSTDMQSLFEYCVVVYPARFFDILYQNNDIFSLESEVNTLFLPNVDFKLLFTCNNITSNTRQTLWKYLQLVLFTVSSSIKDKSGFGDAVKTFEGINQDELQEKLVETVKGMTDFFQFIETSTDASGNTSESKDASPDIFGFGSGTSPSAGGDIHEHLRGLFEGKIGSLAKDLAEDISKDFSILLGDDIENVKSTKDVLHKLMQNPGKITELVKTIGTKLTNKMESGEVSHEELMKEAMGLIGKMKDMGGENNQFQEIFKNLSKMPGMPKMPKIPKMFSKDEMDETIGPTFTGPPSSDAHANMRDKLRARLQKKNQEAAALSKYTEMMTEKNGSTNAKSTDNTSSYNITSAGTPNNYIFSMDNLDKQETTKISDNTSKSNNKKNKKKTGVIKT